MAKTLTRLSAVLAVACCTGAGPALAQPRGGIPAAPAPHVNAPAPHVSAPVVPHISAPVVPHVSTPAMPRISAPTPHVAATPHFNAVPRINAAPHVATPRFSTGAANAHQFTPRGHSFSVRNLHGPTATRHDVGRFAGRSVTRGPSRDFAGRNLSREATHAKGRLARSIQHERSFARGDAGGLAPGGLGNARNRPTGTQLAAVSRPLGERNRNDNDRRRWFHERRRFHHGGFIGWFGPVFWPTAYDDVFDYVFWPAEYDNYGFWTSAYDDVLENAFFAPDNEDISVGEGYVVRSGRGRGARRHTREASRVGSAGDICRIDPGLTQWPSQEISRVVEPNPDQQRLLADLKAASDRAAQVLQAACPTRPPSTPLGRLDAMGKRLDAMLQALEAVRPALAKFYDSLNDEQKARFNFMGRDQGGGGAQANDEARLCGRQAPAGLTSEAIDRIERDVHPDDRQRADLDALREATGKAADQLRSACPRETPTTPVARLDAMRNRVQAMIDAINTVRPALAHFYASLSDEQKAHFNLMNRAARNQ
jgi:LTXXQ motif family protein